MLFLGSLVQYVLQDIVPYHSYLERPKFFSSVPQMLQNQPCSTDMASNLQFSCFRPHVRKQMADSGGSLSEQVTID